MADRTLASVNLNLLPHLEALLRERSVSRAARELHLGQPAVSAALARLRRHFGDDLLTRRGHDLELTPFAVALLPAAAEAVRAMRSVFDAGAVFDPATSTREFVVAAADVWVRTLGTRISDAVGRAAPHARLRFGALGPAVLAEPLEALRAIDVAICPHGLLPGVRHRGLVTAPWVIVAAAGNPDVGDALTVAGLRDATWVATYGTAGGSPPGADRSLTMTDLRRAGVEPRIAVTTDSFLTVPDLVAGTRHLAVLHRPHAEHVADALGLRILDSPVPIRPVVMASCWHPAADGDPGHRWLRDLVTAAATP